MYAIEERYYKINRIILKSLGIWPYQQSYFTQIHTVFIGSILLASIFFQLMLFITRQYNTDLLFTVLSFLLPTLFITIKYFLFIIEKNSFKQLMDHIRDDWNSLKDKLEINIVEKYANSVRIFTICIMAFCYSGLSFYGLYQRLPVILDIMLPLNESRPPYELFMMAEYFVSQDKYSQLILLHEFLTAYIGLIAAWSIAVLYMTYLSHLCALLKITSYRIENAFKRSILAIPCPGNKYLLHRRIINAIVMHQRAIQYSEFLSAIIMPVFAVLITIGIGSFIFNLFTYFQLMISNNTAKTIVSGSLLLNHIFYLFITNYCGQAVINESTDLYKAIYNGLWYAAPLSAQKLLLFMLQRARVNICLSCMSIFVASLDGFTTLTNMVISYFMVIYSTKIVT